ncbi:MAG: hypothetical protein JRI47_06620 [Deltaproteobacteria bacterium]|nr:hypothetical protein [Deltaproteobacteria bacterium]
MFQQSSFLKRMVRCVQTLLVGVSLFFLMTSMTLARPFRIAKTPDKGRNFGCATCHVNPNGGGERNPFGRDYEKFGLKAGDKYTEDLGGLDSDGDGCTNDDEFAAGSHPGDPKSKPDAKSKK